MQTDDNNPGEGTVEVAEAPADNLLDVLGDPDADTNEEFEENAEESEDQDGADTEENAEGDDDDPDAEESEDSGDEEDSESDDGSEEETGGKFVGDNARIRLADGTTTTVKELKDGYSRQSDYTRKTQELAEQRKQAEQELERVSQADQQLREQHERMNAMLEQWKPQPPADPQNDPMGWMQYQQQLHAFNQWEEQLQSEAQKARERHEQEQQQRVQEHFQKEKAQLLEKIPALADDGKRTAFLEEAAKTMGEYGFTKEEIQGFSDHRLIVAMRDLMKAKRTAQSAPKVRDEVKKKPKMLKGGKRGNSKAQNAKRAKADRLRETGRPSDAVSVLMDLGDD